MRYINQNDLSSALFDMYDVRKRVKAMWHEAKDGDGSIFSVKNCLDEVIKFLESLEENSPMSKQIELLKKAEDTLSFLVKQEWFDAEKSSAPELIAEIAEHLKEEGE